MVDLAAGKLFGSFWMAGYEGADHINSQGVALSMNEANRHWQQLDEDYALLVGFGIRTVRESIGWRVTAERGGQGMERLYRQAQLAARHGLDVQWTLMHYGWPAHIAFFSDAFVDEFAHFSFEIAKLLRGIGKHPVVYQPVNEISFLSWAMSATGLMRHPLDELPFVQQGGYAVKCQLVRAAIASCKAIRQADPSARFMHCDPLIHVASTSAETALQASEHTQAACQAWDMLMGRAEPHLGGAPEWVNAIGINYYHANQWALEDGCPFDWNTSDRRRKPLTALLTEVWQRYRLPLVMAETSHVGIGRGRWLDEIASELLHASKNGLPIQGLCLYPILDRPGWDDAGHWHNSGLWDVGPQSAADAAMQRRLCHPYAERIRYWQQHLPLKAAPESAPLNFPLCFSSFFNNQKGIAMPTPTPTPKPTLLVFSHLRWDFVYQRPQHLLSRLAQQYRIVFIEEPVPNAESNYLQRLTPALNVEVLRPHVTSAAWGFHDDHLPVLQSQIAEFLEDNRIEDYCVWFYTPMAVPLMAGLNPQSVIYDCMDELAAFKNAPRQLIQRENALYGMADLVLTGGPSLYESKRQRHSNVHCFASSVDASHFAPAKAVLGSAPPLDHPMQADIAHPRLGYFGVIDERLDLDLIASLADASPEWHIVMVGPVVKISQDSLPQRHNIHWLGQQSYVDLPRFVAGWDVCLMPFALNESTRFISPTKTLEYMAAGKPVVSTRIKDVAVPYGDVVRIADSAAAFAQACAEQLAETAEHKAMRIQRMKEVVARTSWDATAEAIASLISALPQRMVVQLPAEAANSDFGSMEESVVAKAGN